MSKIIVDELQKSGGEAFALPPTKGVTGTVLTSDGVGGTSFQEAGGGGDYITAFDQTRDGDQLTEIIYYFQNPTGDVRGLNINYFDLMPNSGSSYMDMVPVDSSGASISGQWYTSWNGMYNYDNLTGSTGTGNYAQITTTGNYPVYVNGSYNNGVTGTGEISIAAPDSAYPNRMQMKNDVMYRQSSGNYEFIDIKSHSHHYSTNDNITNRTALAGVKFYWNNGSVFSNGTLNVSESLVVTP